VFRDHRKDVCLPIYDQIYNRRLPPKGAQHSARRKAVRAVYVAEGVLEPVLARRYRGLSAVRIMRHK